MAALRRSRCADLEVWRFGATLVDRVVTTHRDNRRARRSPGVAIACLIEFWLVAFPLVAEPSGNSRGADDKVARRAARELVAAYHKEQLGALLDRVREGFAQLDGGEIDEFDLDDLIHRYTRAAADLWKFCGSSGAQWLQAAHALNYVRERGDEPDWWARSAPRRDRPCP
jgi:hypothetical protein